MPVSSGERLRFWGDWWEAGAKSRWIVRPVIGMAGVLSA